MPPLTDQPLPTQLATALAKAQALAVFVSDDKHDSDYKHGYASHQAVANVGRYACAEAGLAIIIAGHRLNTRESPDGNFNLVIIAAVVVAHKSGEVLPTFELQVPIVGGNTVAAVATAQRLAYAQVLGLQWNEPGDGARREKAATRARELLVTDTTGIDVALDVSPKPATTPEEPPEVEDASIVEARDKARTAMQVLRAQFGFASPGDIYATATGRHTLWPPNALEYDYMAVIQLAALCEELTERGIPHMPRTHAAFLLEAEKLDSPEFRPIFINGLPNDLNTDESYES